MTLRATYARAALELDVDTAYTRAQATAARAVLSARTAQDADSLLAMARVRRDAGDASDLDVEMAQLFAGQSINAAVSDSLTAISDQSTLQALIGLSVDSARIELSEPIIAADSGAIAAGMVIQSGAQIAGRVSALPDVSLSVAVAAHEVETASARVLVEQRRRIATPSVSVGFETAGPTSRGLLPIAGFALPLPLFNHNGTGIQLAQAELDRRARQPLGN